MVAELIHIQCGVFNGIANYKIGSKILRFELGTPNYNDYGEYRVNAPFDVYSDKEMLKILDFDEKYVGYKPVNLETSIELSEEDTNWWTSKEFKNLNDFQKDWVVAGGIGEDEDFVIWEEGRVLVKYSDWILTQHDPYKNLMFKVLNVFYHWLRSDDCKTTGGLMIFPEM